MPRLAEGTIMNGKDFRQAGWHERLLWHAISGVVTGLVLFTIQYYVRTSDASAAVLTSRVTTLEIQMGERTQEMKDIQRTLLRIESKLP